MHRFVRLTLPAIAVLGLAAPLAACGGDDDDTPETPITTVAPEATTPGSMTNDTSTDATMDDGSTATTLGDDNAPTEGDTGNGTGSSTG